MARTKQYKSFLTKFHRIDNMKNGTGYLQISTSMTRHYIASRALHRLDSNVLSPPLWNKNEPMMQPHNTYSRHYTLVSPQHRFFRAETSCAKEKRLKKRDI